MRSQAGNFGSVVAVVLAFALGEERAEANLYGFYNITGNSATNAASGEAQLFVEVTDSGAGKVLFTFTNTGPSAASITDVYFDDAGGKLMTLTSISNSFGVDFEVGASPPNLPGANMVGPSFHADFDADSDPPTAPNGVNPGESLGISFDFNNGITFDDVIYNLGQASLRVGIHVQAFGDGGSESFINRMNPVPVPSAFLLGAFGLGLVGWMRRRSSAG